MKEDNRFHVCIGLKKLMQIESNSFLSDPEALSPCAAKFWSGMAGIASCCSPSTCYPGFKSFNHMIT